MKSTLYLSFFLLLLLSSYVGKGQVTADFTASSTEGCSPLQVQFFEQASGNPTSFTWFFGNGNTSDTSDPTVIYITPGTYDVTLIVANGNDVDTVVKKDFVTVFKNPVAQFSADPLAGCAPAPIDFQDNTQLGDAPISTWLWDFGDGKLSSLENPSHTYATGGSFNVSLSVVDENGCESLLAKNDYIKIDEPPKADFSSLEKTSCSAPFAASFSNTTLGQGNLTYQWHFGDGATSNQQNPSHTYMDTGTYDVMLIAINSKGCRDTISRTKFIRVFDLNPQIGASATHGCILPEVTEFQFQNNTISPHNFSFWNFGDNGSSNQQNPTHEYSEKGVYEVKLIIGNGVCLDTSIQKIYVQQLSAEFSMDTSITCDTPFTVNFSENGKNTVAWKWHFGDGDSAIGATTSHTYQEEGEYTVMLTATDQYGCVEDSTAKVIIEVPSVSVITQDSQGCAPLSTVLVAKIDSRFAVDHYEWEFHNGNTIQGPVVTRTYPDTGRFDVKLTAFTKNGCEVSTIKTIEVGQPPAINSAILHDDSLCFGSSFDFTLDYLLADEIKFVFYGAHDVFEVTVDTPNMPVAIGDPGWYSKVVIKPFFNGCPGNEFILNDSFKIIGHRCLFAQGVSDCSDPYTFYFTNNCVGPPANFIWTFPDGSTQHTKDATYTFPDTGTFSVTLTVDSKCANSKTKTIRVFYPEAKISMSDSTGCNELMNVVFDGSESREAEFFEWTYPSGSSFGDTVDQITLDFNSPGTKIVNLIVTDANGCKDKTSKQIHVYQHETEIHNLGNDGGCVPFGVNLQSVVNADGNINLYEWDIDGDSVKFSNDVNLSFDEGGTYTVTLKTQDEYGCSDEAFIDLTASQPEAIFYPDRLEACRYDPILFENFSNPEQGLTYQWFFGDGGMSTDTQPEYGFTKRGVFDVMLVVTDTFGCTDTLLREDYITINAPTADLTVSDSVKPCPPLKVTFIDLSSNDVVKWEWDFGDNSGSVLEKPEHNYTASGTYDVSLVVTNTAGCTDTIVYEELIKIGGPRGKLTVSPDTGCSPLEVTFTVTQKVDVNSAEWDFGDGRSAVGDVVKHTYKKRGVYYPNLVLSNSANCTSTFEAIDTIVVDTMNADFSISDDELCVGQEIQITDQSLGNIKSWSWKIDTNLVTGKQVPPFTFEVGQYQATLVATSNLGCVDSMTKPFEVFADPVVTITGDTFACQGDPAQLIASSNVSSTYQWLPPNGLDQPESRTPLATPSGNTTYSVIATSEQGCTDTSAGFYLSIFPDLKGEAGPDSTIIIGDTVGLFVTHNLPVTGYQWQLSNTLSCDTCPNPVAFPMTSTDYFVTITDTVGCDELTLKAEIIVDDAVHVAIPEAFTPNGDGSNDIMFIQGWGIQELLDFRIYNRWGELVFRTHDLEQGWDGTYRGEAQDPGSFVYVVRARSFSDKVVVKKGSFSLIR